MPDTGFAALFDSVLGASLTPALFGLCLAVGLVCGLLLCGAVLWQGTFSRGFAVTLAILPAVVCAVILMVNGSVGTGVAVAGAFNLVRFRSAPGTAREIGALFVAMGAGLIVGMGYLAYGLLFTLLLGGAMALFTLLRLGAGEERARTLHITIPEDLDYTGVFEPVLDRYAQRCTLTQVKTTNMGSLYRLTYDLTLKKAGQEKALLDQLRRRNGNLEVSLCRQETAATL